MSESSCKRFPVWYIGFEYKLVYGTLFQDLEIGFKMAQGIFYQRLLGNRGKIYANSNNRQLFQFC